MSTGKHSSHSKYIDRDWFTLFKNISRTYKLEEELDAQSFSFHKEHGLIMDYAPPKRKYISAFVKKGKTQFKHLKSQIIKKEKNVFIRNYYLEKCDEELARLDILRLKYSGSKNISNTNKEIFKLHQKLYPIPPKEYFELFINEFIHFIHLVKKSSTLPAIFDVLGTENFYNIQKIDAVQDLHFKISSKPKIDEGKELTSDQIKIILEQFLQELNIKNFKVILKDRNVFSVNTLHKHVSIPKARKYNEKRVTEIIFHEICVHVMRSVFGSQNENDKKQRLKLLTIGRTRNLYIEEGIASYFEQHAYSHSSKCDVPNLLEFYVRFILVYLALNFEPNEVHAKLSILTKFQAYILHQNEEYAQKKQSILLKRVYRDYRKPGKGVANTKIAQYLYGNRVIWQYIEGGGNIFNLFAGKIHINEIAEIQKMNFAIPETYLGHSDFPREHLRAIINRLIKEITDTDAT